MAGIDNARHHFHESIVLYDDLAHNVNGPQTERGGGCGGRIVNCNSTSTGIGAGITYRALRHTCVSKNLL